MGLSGLKTPLNEFSSFFSGCKYSQKTAIQIVHYSICYLIDKVLRLNYTDTGIILCTAKNSKVILQHSPVRSFV